MATASSVDIRTPESALAPSQRMRIAFLLTLVGGFLDAYTYFERGGVFANAQTGNIVMLGIALATGNSGKALAHLIPICTFTLGLLTSIMIKEVLERRHLRLVRRSVLVVEIVGLGIAGLVPLGAEWDIVANSIVSFVAAMQYETFTTFRGEAIVTTMSTGNLRKCIDALFAGTVHADREKLMRSALYASIISTFTLGAVVGTHACALMGRAAMLPAMALLTLAIIAITVLHRTNKRHG